MCHPAVVDIDAGPRRSRVDAEPAGRLWMEHGQYEVPVQVGCPAFQAAAVERPAFQINNLFRFQVVSLNTVGRIIAKNSGGEYHERAGNSRQFLPK